ncbi:MAG: hypothetical protein NVS3B20_18230 [Polyangiales bacterium]
MTKPVRSPKLDSVNAEKAAATEVVATAPPSDEPPPVDHANTPSHGALRGDDCAKVAEPTAVELAAMCSPDRTPEDAELLLSMLNLLRRFGGLIPPARDGGLRTHFIGEHGRTHRLILTHDFDRHEASPLTVIGFFAQRRVGSDELLLAADKELVDELASFPHLVSYTSLELPNGQYGNMVLLDHERAPEVWRERARHVRIVRELAPLAYHAVRIHNGKLSEGVRENSVLTIHHTKYFSYPTPADAGGPLAKTG